MNEPIIHDGQEYKDVFYCSTKVRPSLKLRLSILFCTEFRFEHDSWTKEIMPEQKTIGRIHTISMWDRFKAWRNKGKGYMSSPNLNHQCDTQSQA